VDIVLTIVYLLGIVWALRKAFGRGSDALLVVLGALTLTGVIRPGDFTIATGAFVGVTYLAEKLRKHRLQERLRTAIEAGAS
jgi:hypothetical protein